MEESKFEDGKMCSVDLFQELDEERIGSLKQKLEEAELENISSPIYFIWNVGAVIIGG